MNDAVTFANNPTIGRIREYRKLLEVHPSNGNSYLQYVWYIGNNSPYNPFTGLPEDRRRREAAKLCGFWDIDRDTFTQEGEKIALRKNSVLEAAIKYYTEVYVMPPEEMAGKSAMIFQRQVLKHMENLEKFADNDYEDAEEIELETTKLSSMGSLLKDASNLVKGFTASINHAKNAGTATGLNEEDNTGKTKNSTLANDIPYEP